MTSENGLNSNPEIMQAIAEFPALRNSKNITEFLGQPGYYRRFMPSFSKIAQSLTKLLRMNVKFD
jgi:hypothetical protein